MTPAYFLCLVEQAIGHTPTHTHSIDVVWVCACSIDSMVQCYVFYLCRGTLHHALCMCVCGGVCGGKRKVCRGKKVCVEGRRRCV